jgi:hypothetical protein
MLFLIFNFSFFFWIDIKSRKINTRKVGPATVYHMTTQVDFLRQEIFPFASLLLSTSLVVGFQWNCMQYKAADSV